MRPRARRWATALARMCRAKRGSPASLARESEALREQFDRDYDALLHDTAASLAELEAASSKRKRGA
jgi:hypothetical protein